MDFTEIMRLPDTQRLNHFVERWKELHFHPGIRSADDLREMAAIAEAIMPRLVQEHDDIRNTISSMVAACEQQVAALRPLLK